MKEQLDPVERMMGRSVTVMSASELNTYIREYFKAFGVDWPVTEAGRKILEGLQQRYTRERAGRIVQYVILRRRGRKDGRYITAAMFSNRMKWWTDDVWMEIQSDEARERLSSQAALAEVGFASNMNALIDLAHREEPKPDA